MNETGFIDPMVASITGKTRTPKSFVHGFSHVTVAGNTTTIAFMEFDLPEALSKAITQSYGKTGRKWLDELPVIVQKCEQEWSLTPETGTLEMSCNYVAPVRTADRKRAILKIGFPGEEEVLTEMDALPFFREEHSVRLLASNRERRAFLLEHLIPGTTLRTVQMTDDREATELALPLIRDLPVAVPKEHHFPFLADWAKIFGRMRTVSPSTSMPAALFDKAESVFQKLDASKSEEKLLHGDLHHDNILFDDERGWIAIDPKGVIGDPTFHGSRFIINNWSKVPIAELLPPRVKMIADALKCSEARIAGWAFVDYIISTCWTLETGGKKDVDLPFVQALETMMNP